MIKDEVYYQVHLDGVFPIFLSFYNLFLSSSFLMMASTKLFLSLLRNSTMFEYSGSFLSSRLNLNSSTSSQLQYCAHPASIRSLGFLSSVVFCREPSSSATDCLDWLQTPSSANLVTLNILVHLVLLTQIKV